MSVWWTVPIFIVVIASGVLADNHKADLCEHEGLGKWHTWSQVCEPVRPEPVRP